ncbi:hypothetical protein ASG31_11480 [Chryseobacterium sp. Leaf404]|nr:hypothetical protein ASG31_11480 [Chryseobacterium sp. Leaf404]
MHHDAWGVLIALPCLLLYGFLYYIFLGDNFRLGFVMIFTGLCFGTIVLIIKKSSRNISIWFSEQYMFIESDGKQQKYLKDDISGFYSYDYETTSVLLKKSLIKIKFEFTDGKIIYLNDSGYRNKYDDEKGSVLKSLIQTTQSELGFKKVKSIGMSNKYWYSKPK